MLKARVTFRVMKLGRYVTVDDGGNYVMERSHKDKKIIIIITPHKESLGRLCLILLFEEHVWNTFKFPDFCWHVSSNITNTRDDILQYFQTTSKGERCNCPIHPNGYNT